MYKGLITVTLKPGVLDPQGEAVKRSVGVMGYAGVQEVRIGKFIEVVLEANDEEEAREKLMQMSDQLLANPVMEQFVIQVVEGE